MAQRKRPPARGTGPKGRPTPRRAPARPNAAPQARQGRAAGAGGAGGSGPKPFLTPGGSPFRHAVERRSAVLLVFLHRLPRAVPGLLVLGLLALGLLAPPVLSAVALLLVAVLLTWLVFLGWPTVPTVGRAVRLVVIAMVAGYALARLAA